MAKAFIELRYRQRKFKLNAEDIAKVYKISKRRTPALPCFHEPLKNLPETDDDTEVAVSI
jgi:hypothetical protein